MNDVIKIAQKELLEPADLDESQLLKIVSGILGAHIDYADVYMQSEFHESWHLEDSIVKDGSYNIERGVGVRAISGEKTGFAYSDDILLPALEQSASAAKSIAISSASGSVQAWKKITAPVLYSQNNPLDSLATADKIQLLRHIDIHARSLDTRVTQVSAALNGVYEVVMVYNSDGSMGADIRPLVRLDVSVVVESNGKRETGSYGGGGRGDYGDFFTLESVEHYANEAVRLALLNLDAVPAPAGTMPVVLGAGWPGVMLHEAVGHGLEGDFNRKGLSAFSGRIGERVAAPGVTVVDDGTLPGRRGSLSIDDEGTVTEKTILIEDGILKGYMHDKLSAKLMNAKPTGNGRRESYAHSPMPRMTNTYMLPGKYDPAEIIASVNKGIYAVNFSGGQVDITSGKFVFTANEAYLIENGKITRPIKGATLIGDGPEAMKKVSLVGHDLKLDSGVGVCGKEGQSVPVGVGQPTYKIDELTVGGTHQDA